MKMRFVALAALALLPVPGNAAPCESEDFENRISGASTCLFALDATHNSVVRSQMVSDAIAGLVNDR